MVALNIVKNAMVKFEIEGSFSTVIHWKKSNTAIWINLHNLIIDALESHIFRVQSIQ